MTRPPGSGHAPRLNTPNGIEFFPAAGVRKSFDQSPAPRFGVNTCVVRRTFSRVFRWSL
jgi:hypothetical protein